MAAVLLSLVVPTRRRPAELARFLASVAATAARPDRLEVVLVADADDPASGAVNRPGLAVRAVVGPAGRTMGELNRAGVAAAGGRFVMLLNDDVVVRTRHWDRAVYTCLRRFPDDLVLVHVNDTLMRHHLCTFPLVSRRFCDLAGGVCPPDYERYRIDDHVEDVFNRLAHVGVRRTVYLPDVVFEHLNGVDHPTAGRIYLAEPTVLARDAVRFDAHAPARAAAAERMLRHLGNDNPAALDAAQAANDAFALRVEGRQLVVRSAWWRRLPELAGRATAPVRRLANCCRRGGLWRAVGKRVGF